MRRVLVIGLCAVVSVACGSSSKRASNSTKSTTTVESAETKAWSDAAARGVLASAAANSEHMSATDAGCIGRALVDSVTVARLKAAGVTVAELSDSKQDLPKSLAASLSPSTKLALGAAMQACGFGRIVGPAFADSFGSGLAQGFTVDAATRTCMATAMNAPARRLFVAESVLRGANSAPSSADIAVLVDLAVRCLDWGAVFAAQMHIAFSAAEAACVNQRARLDNALRSALLAEAEGKSGKQGGELFGASLVKCLTPAHLLQLGKASQ